MANLSPYRGFIKNILGEIFRILINIFIFIAFVYYLPGRRMKISKSQMGGKIFFFENNLKNLLKQPF
jgi:hypothetical protein